MIKNNKLNGKVQIVHVFGYGPDKIGGLENYILELNKQNELFSSEIIFIFTREPISEFKSLFNDLKGTYYVIPHDKSVLNISFLIRLYKVLKNLNPDIIHSHFDSANLHVAIISKFLKTKKVFWHQRNLFGSKLSFIRNIVYRYLSKNVSNIIAISNSIKEDLIERGVSLEKILVLHNGIKIEKPRLSTNIRNELNLKSNEKIILTVAQARPEKDLVTLIKSIPLLNDIEHLTFLLIGGGELVNELKAKAEELNINNLVFLDKRNDIREIMSESNIFVLTSVREGLSNVITEAMVNNLPVIATNAGGIPELVKDEKTGYLLNTSDYIKLSQLIRKVLKLEKKEEIQQIKINAYDHIEKNFNVEKKVEYTFKNIYGIGND
ncbi:glycosyltransferase family 4 protein [Peribacillus frigoritolerans]